MFPAPSIMTPKNCSDYYKLQCKYRLLCQHCPQFHKVEFNDDDDDDDDDDDNNNNNINNNNA